ncbi:MAG: hypothetical protein JXB47_18040 [Anaerolineae bacterium]|nr:hypothetical protein [Anaerolineae bacterium]
MITPAGKECPHYYQDFHRGRSTQECRLIAANPESKPWRSKDCANCPVPDILRANASPDLMLKAHIDNGFLGLGLIGVRVAVEAYCDKHSRPIKDPYVGCDLCNAERPGLAEILEQIERDS